jgi:hypothetical protein
MLVYRVHTVELVIKCSDMAKVHLYLLCMLALTFYVISCLVQQRRKATVSVVDELKGEEKIVNQTSNLELYHDEYENQYQSSDTRNITLIVPVLSELGPHEEKVNVNQTSTSELHHGECEKQHQYIGIRNITILVPLVGELGNHLSLLANARVTQLIAERKFPGIKINIIGQHHKSPKWKRAYSDLIHCFPSFKNFIFDGGLYDPYNDHEFQTVQEMQKKWLNITAQQKLENVREDGLDFVQYLIYQLEKNDTFGLYPHSINSTVRYSLPYLIANDFFWDEGLKNQLFYDDLRKWLRFDFKSKKCCGLSPNPTEIVYL